MTPDVNDLIAVLYKDSARWYVDLYHKNGRIYQTEYLVKKTKEAALENLWVIGFDTCKEIKK